MAHLRPIIATRRGRPRAAEPHATVATWLPASEHDRVIQLAMRQGLTISRCLRGILQQAVGSNGDHRPDPE